MIPTKTIMICFKKMVATATTAIIDTLIAIILISSFVLFAEIKSNKSSNFFTIVPPPNVELAHFYDGEVNGEQAEETYHPNSDRIEKLIGDCDEELGQRKSEKNHDSKGKQPENSEFHHSLFGD